MASMLKSFIQWVSLLCGFHLTSTFPTQNCTQKKIDGLPCMSFLHAISTLSKLILNCNIFFPYCILSDGYYYSKACIMGKGFIIWEWSKLLSVLGEKWPGSSSKCFNYSCCTCRGRSRGSRGRSRGGLWEVWIFSGTTHCDSDCLMRHIWHEGSLQEWTIRCVELVNGVYIITIMTFS